MPGGHLQAGIFRQLGGNGSAGLGIAGIVHVAVHAGQRIPGQFQKLALEGCGRFHLRVSQGKIEDFVGPVLLAETLSFFEHLANPG